MALWCAWPIGIYFRMDMFFAQVIFRMRYEALKARSFRKTRVNLYRRTPQMLRAEVIDTLLYSLVTQSPSKTGYGGLREVNKKMLLRCIG